MKSTEIRSQFIEFFKARGHKHVPSSPLVPPDDPTLLFNTAGMVQFKPLYAGNVQLPYSRACSVQKCLRAGGKGSDLENVGRTLRHHTFFEMLGNFSFGDYFKEDALIWAWEFCMKVMRFNPEHLYASVYEEDDDAWKLWVDTIGMPENHMVRLGAKDNFWGPAGESGACGPCSEIYYDRGEQWGKGLTFQRATIDDNDPGSRYLEFWNCVFPQFDQQTDGTRLPLKNRGVDTGMGLERLACIAQDCASPFETDHLFPIVEAICGMLGIQSYKESPEDIRQAVNVITDHTRALVFALSEGILPSNEGRGYVLRRLLRRAARFARKTGQEEPFMFKVVEPILEVMGGVYPEILQTPDVTQKVIRLEEESYAKTLGAGLSRLESLVERLSTGHSLSGEHAFDLVTTYGFPLEDIHELLADRGISVNMADYEKLYEAHRETSRKTAAGGGSGRVQEIAKRVFQQHGKTGFVGYPPQDDAGEDLETILEDSGGNILEAAEQILKKLNLGSPKGGSGGKTSSEKSRIVPGLTGDPDDIEGDAEFEDDDELSEHEMEFDPDDGEFDDLFDYPLMQLENSEVFAIIRGEDSVESCGPGDQVILVLEMTPFYAEAGGQIGDSGVIMTEDCVIRISTTQKTPEEIYLHVGEVERGELHVGDFVTAEINLPRRLAIMRNHTATHLLQGALKRVIGKHVAQQGSYVGPDYLRFDFTNPEALSAQQVIEVERLVNEQIMRDSLLETQVLPLEEARKLPGIIAPFGEKYGGTVRVVNVPDWDVEFCGGTHMVATGGIGPFAITSESAVASGVRRIEAVTGDAAIGTIQRERGVLKHLSEQLSIPRENVGARVSALNEEVRALRKELERIKSKQTSGEAGALLDGAREINGILLVTHEFSGLDVQGLRTAYDAVKSKRPKGLVAVLGSNADGRVTLIAGATADAIERGVSAGDLIRYIAPIVEGSGGGKKEMAQAGGKAPEKIREALKAAGKWIEDKLK